MLTKRSEKTSRFRFRQYETAIEKKMHRHQNHVRVEEECNRLLRTLRSLPSSPSRHRHTPADRKNSNSRLRAHTALDHLQATRYEGINRSNNQQIDEDEEENKEFKQDDDDDDNLRETLRATYHANFSGMQQTGNNGLSRLENIISAAINARDKSSRQTSPNRSGAAVLSSTGTIFSGCTVPMTQQGSNVSMCAERVALLQALAEDNDCVIEVRLLNCLNIFFILKTSFRAWPFAVMFVTVCHSTPVERVVNSLWIVEISPFIS